MSSTVFGLDTTITGSWLGLVDVPHPDHCLARAVAGAVMAYFSPIFSFHGRGTCSFEKPAVPRIASPIFFLLYQPFQIQSTNRISRNIRKLFSKSPNPLHSARDRCFYL